MASAHWAGWCRPNLGQKDGCLNGIDIQSLMLIAARVAALYFAWITLVRLAGGRLGSLTLIDLPVVLIAAGALGDLVRGTLPVWKGALLVGSVAVWHVAHIVAMSVRLPPRAAVRVDRTAPAAMDGLEDVADATAAPPGRR